MKQELSGLLLVDKPVGWSSHDVVAYVRRIAGQKSVGHTGTLDPLASGLMIVLLGEATKLSSFFTEKNKSYFVEAALGLETESLDITGPITYQTNEGDFDAQDFLKKYSIFESALLENLSGEKEYEIPLYSAKKINGTRLYELAHADEKIEELPKKMMSFFNIQSQAEFAHSAMDLKEWVKSLEIRKEKFPHDERLKKELELLCMNAPVLESSLKLRFSIECSKGSFIRSWVQKLGQELHKRTGLRGATVSALRRVETLGFRVEETIALKNLNTNSLQQGLIPLSQALMDIKKLLITGQELNLLKNGQIGHSLRSQLIQVFNPDEDEIVQVHERVRSGVTHLVALIGFQKDKGFVIKRVFLQAKN